MPGKLYVCPAMNTYGPATDPKHADLLTSWDDVNAGNSKYFTDSFRNALLDSRGKKVVLSWYACSWSGFKTNPVQRDFGWFNIFDKTLNKFGKEIEKFNDGFFWIYNHPDKDGVGNAWGLEWLENAQYLHILNKFILDRSYFPAILQVPTINTDTTNFIEEYFPYQISNRSSRKLNWNNIEADGKLTKDVLQWERGPDNWIPYSPSEIDHQLPGQLKQKMLRVMDIKTRIIHFPEEEIFSAFEQCRKGHDCIISGYEHDFRDRCDAVVDLFLQPISRISKKYPDIEIVNATSFEACNSIFANTVYNEMPTLNVSLAKDQLIISSTQRLYSSSPYVAIRDKVKNQDFHINPTKIGLNTWGISRAVLPEIFTIGLGGFSLSRKPFTHLFEVNQDKKTIEKTRTEKQIPMPK